MRPVYALLGFSVGLITQDIDDEDRRAAYACDITYGTASEFGLDFLRDNLKFRADETVQRGHAFALVDEADATLIDDAGVPLALYGPLGDQSGFYHADRRHRRRADACSLRTRPSPPRRADRGRL